MSGLAGAEDMVWIVNWIQGELHVQAEVWMEGGRHLLTISTMSISDLYTKS